MFLRLADAQRLFVFGQPIVSGFVVNGTIRGPLPKGLIDMTNAQVMASLRRPVKVTASTIAFLDILLWIVAAGIIGTILYMTSLERLRDFAALKPSAPAVLSRDRYRRTGVGTFVRVRLDCVDRLESVDAVVPDHRRDPAGQLSADVERRVMVGLLGNIAGVRRVIAIDPALAFGG